MNTLKKFTAFIITLSLLLSAFPLSSAARSSLDEAVTQTKEIFENVNKFENEKYENGEILFTINEENASRSSTLSSVKDDFGLKILEEIDRTALKSGVTLSSVGEGEQTVYRASFDEDKYTVTELCKALNSYENIKDCEPNYIYTSCEFTMPAEITGSAQYSSLQKQYMQRMNMPETWEKYENLGEGTVVCVIDSGLNYTHNDIKNRLWSDAEGNHGYNAEFNNHDIYGKEEGGPSHGSHCSGIIAMEDGNGGLVGVAPRAKIMMCNAVTASTGYFTNSNLIKSLEYAVANGADVISMSLGGYSFSVNLEKTLQMASYSAVICCAAGNDGYNTTKALHYPSASPAVIGVMALGSGSTGLQKLSSYSNYDLTGKYYQIAAPGTSIYSIDCDNDTEYVSMSGTSMATPFAAGLCALYASEHPELSPTEMRRAIIDDAGEMVKGYKSDAQTPSFKCATPLTLLESTPAAAEEVRFNDTNVEKAVRKALNVSERTRLTNYDLESVTALDLSGVTLDDYSVLSYLPSLAYLKIKDSALTDSKAEEVFNHISNKLINLNFSGNALTSLDFLNDFDGFLSKVDVSGNKLNDISALEKYTMLYDLDISSNEISDISAISGLTGMKVFYAPGNRISDTSALTDLTAIEEIYFGNYNPNLADLYLESRFTSGNEGNYICDLTPLTRLNKNSNLRYLNLSYNYINKDKEYNLHIAQIQNILTNTAENYFRVNNPYFSEKVYKLVTAPFSSGGAVFAQDIRLEKTAISLVPGDSYKISYTVLPENADAGNAVSFTSSSPSVATVTADGTVTPVKAGSTTISVKLLNGKTKLFFVNVREPYIRSAKMLDSYSVYSTAQTYSVLVYTSLTKSIKLTAGETVLGTFDAESYAVTLKDGDGVSYMRWIVPVRINESGNITITAYAISDGEYNTSGTASFTTRIDSKINNTISGVITSYGGGLNVTLTLYNSEGKAVQTAYLSGLSGKNIEYCLSNVSVGTYTLKIEKDGYADTYEEIKVNNAITSCDVDLCYRAGDINCDNTVDISDISIVFLSENYARSASEAANALCDIDGDGYITVSDISIITANIK